MAIPTTGATVTTAVSAAGSSSSSLIAQHTTDASTNLLIVIVTYGYPTTIPHATVVTFDGNALTELGTVEYSNDARCDIWYRKNPPIKTGDISVGSFGGAARLGWTAINVIGANVSGTTFGTHQTLAASTTDLSVTLSSAVDQLIIGGAVNRIKTNTLTAQSGVTQLSNFAHGAQGVFATGKKTGATSVGFGFTSSAGSEGVAIAVPVMPDSPAANLEMYGWRMRADDGNESSTGATFLKAENIGITVGPNSDVTLNSNFRVRLGLDETNIGNPASATAQIIAKRNGGTAFVVDGSSTYLRMSASPNETDGAATTDHGLTAPAGTFIAGAFDEVDGLTAAIDLAQNQYTIVEGCMQARSADLVHADTLELGLRVSGTDYFSGAVMATVSTYIPTAPATVASGAVTDTTIVLTWTDPNTPDVEIRPYYKENGASTWIPEGTLAAGITTHTFGLLQALTAETLYDVGVAAYSYPAESAIIATQGTTTATPRQAHVTAFELETSDEIRKAHITAFELEAEPAARQAHVTAFELESGDAAAGNRAAHVTAFELEAEPAAREARVTSFELEAENAQRAAHVTAFELETGTFARQARVTAFELQVYDAAQGDPEATLGRLGLGLSSIGIGV